MDSFVLLDMDFLVDEGLVDSSFLCKKLAMMGVSEFFLRLFAMILFEG